MTDTAGKVGVWRIGIFVGGGISGWAVDTGFSPDVAIKPGVGFVQGGRSI